MTALAKTPFLGGRVTPPYDKPGVILTDTTGKPCLLYTSDAADERSSVDLGGRRIIKKKNKEQSCRRAVE